MGDQKKKKAAREEDARPDLEYGWEEECRIRHRVLGGGVNPMTNEYPQPLYSTTANNAYQLCKYADA
ncbi:hypothetical protein CES85_0359 [Ochrobactrum quorumnocens]|uniref:Uncharacterized protein n=1 Tax=Ochrobactrum quorumnocens TaxID=271865 RepID=A0A248UFQ3_9HYPH|nr:hypothetical protein CES85_0359 [[Ochrobactrum] quorumnocens]